MGFLNDLINKGVDVITNKKSLNIQNFTLKSPYSVYSRFGLDNLGFYNFLHYYSHVSVIFTAISIVVREMAALKVVLKDGDKIIKKHPLLDLLNKPNNDLTYFEFMEQGGSFYKITGNNFWMATGPIEKDPKELFVLQPQSVSILPGLDGFPETYSYTTNNGTFDFKKEVINGSVRFVSKTKEQEIWQTRTFNPFYNRSNLFGMSELMPIFYEIEQFMATSIHNTNILKKGARPSGILSKKGSAFTDEQRQKLKEQVENFYSGPENSGNIMLLESEDGLEFIPMILNSRDMDYDKLIKTVTTMIYNSQSIPLPIVDQSSSTFNNMETGLFMFYHKAVFPLADKLFAEMTRFLIPRYKDLSDTTQITFIKSDVEAIKTVAIETSKRLQEIGVLSINELRTVLGYGHITEGGNSVYLPATLLPIGEDEFTEGDSTRSKKSLKAPKSAREKFEYACVHSGMDKEEVSKLSEEHYGKPK